MKTMNIRHFCSSLTVLQQLITTKCYFITDNTCASTEPIVLVIINTAADGADM